MQYVLDCFIYVLVWHIKINQPHIEEFKSIKHSLSLMGLFKRTLAECKCHFKLSMILPESFPLVRTMCGRIYRASEPFRFLDKQDVDYISRNFLKSVPVLWAVRTFQDPIKKLIFLRRGRCSVSARNSNFFTGPVVHPHQITNQKPILFYSHFYYYGLISGDLVAQTPIRVNITIA